MVGSGWGGGSAVFGAGVRDVVYTEELFELAVLVDDGESFLDSASVGLF